MHEDDFGLFSDEEYERIAGILQVNCEDDDKSWWTIREMWNENRRRGIDTTYHTLYRHACAAVEAGALETRRVLRGGRWQNAYRVREQKK